jgi:hypothetical protein
MVVIEPTTDDIGRRVRWLSRTYGELKGVEGGDALIALEVPPPHDVFLMALVSFTDLHWADNLGHVLEAGEQEPDPAFPRLRRVHHVS